ncbi:hypothetical protein S245_067659, partial [Arachis hypogaea]
MSAAREGSSYWMKTERTEMSGGEGSTKKCLTVTEAQRTRRERSRTEETTSSSCDGAELPHAMPSWVNGWLGIEELIFSSNFREEWGSGALVTWVQSPSLPLARSFFIAVINIFPFAAIPF